MEKETCWIGDVVQVGSFCQLFFYFQREEEVENGGTWAFYVKMLGSNIESYGIEVGFMTDCWTSRKAAQPHWVWRLQLLIYPLVALCTER
jgi:hypothetical protein